MTDGRAVKTGHDGRAVKPGIAGRAVKSGNAVSAAPIRVGPRRYVSPGRGIAALDGVRAIAVALVLAAVSESASYDLLVYFVVGQFPIYMLPLVAVPIYRRVVGIN